MRARAISWCCICTRAHRAILERARFLHRGITYKQRKRHFSSVSGHGVRVVVRIRHSPEDGQELLALLVVSALPRNLLPFLRAVQHALHARVVLLRERVSFSGNEQWRHSPMQYHSQERLGHETYVRPRTKHCFRCLHSILHKQGTIKPLPCRGIREPNKTSSAKVVLPVLMR